MSFTPSCRSEHQIGRRFRCIWIGDLGGHGVEEPIPTEAIAEFADILTVDLSPERVVLGEKALEEALSALGKLGARARAMFYLYRFENLKVREIAQMYGISTSWVEKQLERVLLHITRRLHRT